MINVRGVLAALGILNWVDLLDGIRTFDSSQYLHNNIHTHPVLCGLQSRYVQLSKTNTYADY